MPDAEVLVPLDFAAAGCTARLRLERNADLPPGLHRCSCMHRVGFPVPAGELGFLATVTLAYHVALSHYDLSAGLSLVWCFSPCLGKSFPTLEGESAGAAFLLAFLKARFGEFGARALRNHGEIEAAIAAARLEWVGVTASIDNRGNFLPVAGGDPLRRKLIALAREHITSRARMAVICQQQMGIVLEQVKDMDSLYMFDAGLAEPLPVLRATNATDCFSKLFRLQAEQVLL
jgi:hypothetical protein